MTKTESGKKYALAAAICCLVNPIYYISIAIIYNFIGYILDIFIIVEYTLILGMAVALFINNEKAFVVAAGVEGIRCLYFFTYYSPAHITALVSIVIVVVLTLKGNGVIKKIWFVPAALELSNCVILWIEPGYFSWLHILFDIVCVAEFIFVGMWMKEKMSVQDATVVEYATFDPQRIDSTSTFALTTDGTDKLKMYKELLESDIITQEEFDAKKKQILGL